MNTLITAPVRGAPGPGGLLSHRIRSLRPARRAVSRTGLPALSGTGAWAESVLYAFGSSSPSDGCKPYNTQLLFDKKTGSLYGTTELGGGTAAGGTLFKIQVSGTTHYTLTYVPVYNFLGGATDGAFPSTGLAGNSAGNVYGMTEIGGAADVGTLFKYEP